MRPTVCEYESLILWGESRVNKSEWSRAATHSPNGTRAHIAMNSECIVRKSEPSLSCFTIFFFARLIFVDVVSGMCRNHASVCLIGVYVCMRHWHLPFWYVRRAIYPKGEWLSSLSCVYGIIAQKYRRPWPSLIDVRWSANLSVIICDNGAYAVSARRVPCTVWGEDKPHHIQLRGNLMFLQVTSQT